jgi:REP element-mobilizing transposase RayT
MTYNPDIHHPRSIRLQGYDYSSAGAYFITSCTQNRECLFGNIIVGATPRGCPGPGLNENGPISGNGQARGPGNNGQAQENGQPRGPAPTGKMGTLSLGDIVHRFKTMTTKRYADGVKQLGWQSFAGKLWQRNYWEHIIRNEMELNRIREYIHDNPSQWESDRLNLHNDRSVCPSMVRDPAVAYTAEGWMV